MEDFETSQVLLLEHLPYLPPVGLNKNFNMLCLKALLGENNSTKVLYEIEKLYNITKWEEMHAEEVDNFKESNFRLPAVSAFPSFFDIDESTYINCVDAPSLCSSPEATDNSALSDSSIDRELENVVSPTDSTLAASQNGNCSPRILKKIRCSTGGFYSASAHPIFSISDETSAGTNKRKRVLQDRSNLCHKGV